MPLRVVRVTGTGFRSLERNAVRICGQGRLPRTSQVPVGLLCLNSRRGQAGLPPKPMGEAPPGPRPSGCKRPVGHSISPVSPGRTLPSEVRLTSLLSILNLVTSTKTLCPNKATSTKARQKAGAILNPRTQGRNRPREVRRFAPGHTAGRWVWSDLGQPGFPYPWGRHLSPDHSQDPHLGSWKSPGPSWAPLSPLHTMPGNQAWSCGETLSTWRCPPTPCPPLFHQRGTWEPLRAARSGPSCLLWEPPFLATRTPVCASLEVACGDSHRGRRGERGILSLRGSL